MKNFQLTTPVVFIIFNRPDKTEQVFAEIRRAKPKQLLVIADGPRSDRMGEEKKCAETREIINKVDWDCQVLTNFSDVNLGCKKRVSSGLDWVFEIVEEAIILEDDCLPHPSFFQFCQELLSKYRNDERVMMISGDNFQFGERRTGDSYYFSLYTHIWGWASWRRAWKHYDIDMKLWPEVHDGKWLYDILHDENHAQWWEDIFLSTYKQKFNGAWSYQWLFTCWIQNGLTILPNVNLISNIGFDEDATNTFGENKLANMPIKRMEFPLKHPNMVIRDVQADEYTQREIFGLPLIDVHVLQEIKEISKVKNIGLFGAGSLGERALEFLRQNGIRVDVIFDNDKNKWSCSIEGISIANPKIIDESYFIIIATSWWEEVMDQLNDKSLKKEKHYIALKQ